MTEIKTEAERVGACECEVCQYGREVRRHLALLPEEARPFFENMYESLCYTENDLNYAQAVLDGSWPSAVPQLQRALDEAWRIARERGYDRDWPIEPLSLQDELVEALELLSDALLGLSGMAGLITEKGVDRVRVAGQWHEGQLATAYIETVREIASGADRVLAQSQARSLLTRIKSEREEA